MKKNYNRMLWMENLLVRFPWIKKNSAYNVSLLQAGRHIHTYTHIFERVWLLLLYIFCLSRFTLWIYIHPPPPSRPLAATTTAAAIYMQGTLHDFWKNTFSTIHFGAMAYTTTTRVLYSLYKRNVHLNACNVYRDVCRNRKKRTLWGVYRKNWSNFPIQILDMVMENWKVFFFNFSFFFWTKVG